MPIMDGKITNYLFSLSILEHNLADYYRWILNTGKFYTKQIALIDPYAPETFTPKPQHCFNNSMQLAMEHLDLSFVEGFYIPKNTIALEHAWCLNPKKEVVDITSFIGDFKVSEYFGVEIPGIYFNDYITSERRMGFLHWYYTQIVLKENGRKIYS